MTGASLADGGIAVFADMEANGSRLEVQGAVSAPGEIADIAIGVASADAGSAPFLPPAQPKKRFKDDILPSIGEVVDERGTGSGAGGGNVVISFRGEFLGVILKVARGLVGALIGRPRTKFWSDSLSDLERE